VKGIQCVALPDSGG